MPVNKFGSYITTYRAKKKEAAQRDREERLDLERRQPQIIDPSFELFKNQALQEHGSRSYASTPNSTDDWTFHTRRASTMPHSYQFEPYCEVTPKSSTSSSNSKVSEDAPSVDKDTPYSTVVGQRHRPRPQSSLPPISSASHSFSTSDLHRDLAHSSRRQSALEERSISDGVLTLSTSSRTSLPSLSLEKPSQPYKLQASLNRPFSLSEPYDALESPIEPEGTDEYTSSGLTTIPEDFGTLNYHEDLLKRGYIL